MFALYDRSRFLTTENLEECCEYFKLLQDFVATTLNLDLKHCQLRTFPNRGNGQRFVETHRTAPLGAPWCFSIDKQMIEPRARTPLFLTGLRVTNYENIISAARQENTELFLRFRF